MRQALAFTVSVLALSAAALAGVNNGACVAVHVMDHASRGCGRDFPEISSCEDIVTTLEGDGDVDCFPVFYWLHEYKAFDYGLSWPGTYSCVFTSCSDVTVGDIVDPGDGISHAWGECQAEHVAVVGWGWITEPGEATICVVEHPTQGGINIADCHEGIDQPEYGPDCAGIGGAEGDDPCDERPTPPGTEQSTWGGVKSLFR